MTQEEYVSFDVAKLLHEKGFEIDIDKDYWKIGKDGTRYFMSSIGAYTSDINNKHAFYRPANSYPCPTQQMAMRWLREEHHIVIGINVGNENKKDNKDYSNPDRWWYFWEWTNDRGVYKEELQPDALSNEYSTYEEACEAAIKYCLENLINNQQ